jgi:hypothetical protein
MSNNGTEAPARINLEMTGWVYGGGFGMTRPMGPLISVYDFGRGKKLSPSLILSVSASISPESVLEAPACD